MEVLRFDGRVAIVTGAGGNPGLGRSYALMLAERGAQVLVNDIGGGVAGSSDNAAAAAVVEEIVAAGGTAVADTHSIAEPEDAAAVVQAALDQLGGLDIVINNAGVCIFADLDEITEEHIDLTIGVNLLGTIWMCRAAWPHFHRSGYGRILNVTSGAMFGFPNATIYSAAKAGVVGFTRSLASVARDLADVRCNVIAPAAGTRAAEVVLREGSDVLADMMDNASPDDVAATAAVLVHESCTANGEVIESVAGEVSRVVLERGRPVAIPNATPEAIRDRFDDIMNVRAASVIDLPDADVAAAVAAAAKPYRSAGRSA